VSDATLVSFLTRLNGITVLDFAHDSIMDQILILKKSLFSSLTI